MSTFNKLCIGFISVYIIRLAVSLSMGMMPQDAYYYFYSQNIALSYFDHPPMVAYFLKVFTSILGSSVVAIKLSNFLLSLGSFLSFYYLGKLFVSETRAKHSAILYGSSILLTVLSMNTTPDVPLIFFWTLSLIGLYKAIFEGKVLHWILSGLFIGMSFDSKYTALFLLACLVLFLLLSNKYRKYLFSYQFLLLLIVFAATVSPVFIWNIEHDWMSFKFQGSERTDSIMKFKIQPHYFGGNIGTQIMLLLPILFVGMMVVMYKHIAKLFKTWKLPNERVLFLICFSLPIMLFFYGISLIYWVKLNWLMPAYIAGIILTGIYIKTKYLKPTLIISMVLHVLLLSQMIFFYVPIKSDDTWFGWEESAAAIHKVQEANPKAFLFSADDYKTTAVMNYYLDEKVYAQNIIGGNALHYMVVDNDLSHLIGNDAIFIDSDKRIKNLDKKGSIPESIQAYFDTCEELEPIVIRDRYGKPQRKFHLFKCTNYKGAKQLSVK
ncbi:ArnT family glycosyltransferase [Saccharicrinis aurantiacus]|uniref:ArnT family glycosyltransferase n=1 Tax=Saccharicrinis aurantiacus TaxID=1849719 RepID=UPI0009502BE3|nr:glycosyltransferase family 39 protein [Saccharicrinis aurantiacus]